MQIDQTIEFDPRRPFGRAQARAAGISVKQLLGPGYRKLFYDRYVAADVRIDVRLYVEAALAISAPGSYAFGRSAARLHGGIVPPDGRTHIAVPGTSHRSRRDGVDSHVARAGADVVVHRGVRTSGPAQCVRDLGDDLGLVDLVVLGDSLVQAGAVTVEDLCTAARGWSGRGASAARRAVALVRSGAESPMETRLRLLIVLAGLPEPLVQVDVVDHDGGARVRVDLCWPRWRVVAEYDGRQHAESTVQWRRDLERREILDRLDHRVVVVLADGIYGTPEATLDRLVGVLRERGADVRVQGTAWRRHFPGRAAR